MREIPIVVDYEDLDTGEKGKMIANIDLNQAKNWVGSTGDAGISK